VPTLHLRLHLHRVILHAVVLEDQVLLIFIKLLRAFQILIIFTCADRSTNLARRVGRPVLFTPLLFFQLEVFVEELSQDLLGELAPELCAKVSCCELLRIAKIVVVGGH